MPMVMISPDTLAARKAAALAPRRAQARDANAVAGVLSSAFETDAVANYFLRQDHKRDAARLDFFRLIATMAMDMGEVWLAEHEGDALAATIWAPSPGTLKTTLLQEIQMTPRFIACAGFSGLPRLMRLRKTMDAKHPRAPHWYLFFLGVAHTAQGQGLGSAILGANLARVDAERADAYLENSNARNLGLYQRAGFVVREEFQPEAGGPNLWAMWRDRAQG